MRFILLPGIGLAIAGAVVFAESTHREANELSSTCSVNSTRIDEIVDDDGGTTYRVTWQVTFWGVSGSRSTSRRKIRKGTATDSRGSRQDAEALIKSKGDSFPCWYLPNSPTEVFINAVNPMEPGGALLISGCIMFALFIISWFDCFWRRCRDDGGLPPGGGAPEDPGGESTHLSTGGVAPAVLAVGAAAPREAQAKTTPGSRAEAESREFAMAL